MTTEQTSTESTGSEGTGIVRDYIREALYPVEDFPRHIFLNFDQIMIDHFVAVVLPVHQGSILDGQNRETMKRVAGEQLSLVVLLRDHPQVLMQIYAPLIRRFLKQKTADKDQQQDIYQEIAVRLLHKKLSSIHRHYRFDFAKKRLFSSNISDSMRFVVIIKGNFIV